MNADTRRALVLVVDRSAAGPDLLAAIRAAVLAGVDRVQVRDRRLAGAALLAHARAVAAAAREGAEAAGREVEVLVNRRVDIALAIAADGVHLGFDAMSLAEAARLLPATARIGVSTHSAAEAAEVALAGGADYVQLAPIFDPLSKPAERAALGTAAVRAAAASGLAVIAQGGISQHNAREVCAAGAAGVAVTGAILLAPDVGAATRALRLALGD